MDAFESALGFLIKLSLLTTLFAGTLFSLLAEQECAAL
jgi:hypothetical protein